MAQDRQNRDSRAAKSAGDEGVGLPPAEEMVRGEPPTTYVNPVNINSFAVSKSVLRPRASPFVWSFRAYVVVETTDFSRPRPSVRRAEGGRGSGRGENEQPNMQEVTVGGQTILEAEPRRRGAREREGGTGEAAGGKFFSVTHLRFDAGGVWWARNRERAERN